MQKSLALVRGFFVFSVRMFLLLSFYFCLFADANSLMSFGQLSLIRRGAYPFSF
jgi:hypothetical protein